MAFGYSDAIRKPGASPYYYGEGICAVGGDEGEGETTGDGGSDTGVITCGEFEFDNGDGTTTWKPYGNVHPTVSAGGDMVPSSDAKIVKLTIFI